MGGIQNALHFLQSDAGVFDIVTHAVGVRLKRFDSEFGSDRPEGKVIFKKIVVPIDMRHRENLERERIVTHEISDSGIGVDHHLVGKTAQAVVIQGFELLVGLAIGPVRVVRRHAGIDHVREHLFVVTDLELLRIRIQTELLDEIDNPVIPLLKVFDGVGGGHRLWGLCRVVADAVLIEKSLERRPDILFTLNLNGLKVGLRDLRKELDHTAAIVPRP